MKKLFISEEYLKILIGKLKKTCDEFIAPKREHLDDVIFCDTKNGGGEILNYEGNSIVSPRSFLLPYMEPLFEIRSSKTGQLVPIEDNKRRVFYGVRPCDITALKLMHSFFSVTYVDAPYEEKFKRSTFLALGCTVRCSLKSFCHEIGTGPYASDGFDLQLIPLKSGFIVDVGSKRGRDTVKANRNLFKKASPKEEKERKALYKEFIKGSKPVDYKKLFNIMKLDKVKDAIWEDIGLRCVVCSGCITLCPTCSCFSIADRMNPALSMNSVGDRRKGGVNGDSGIRLRYCDGCPYAGFTRMAGGTTPFPLHRDHIRRFFEHKLNVDVERYGRPSCVGCGRCINTCLGNISIRKFIDDALKV